MCDLGLKGIMPDLFLICIQIGTCWLVRSFVPESQSSYKSVRSVLSGFVSPPAVVWIAVLLSFNTKMFSGCEEQLLKEWLNKHGHGHGGGGKRSRQSREKERGNKG